VSEFGHRSHLSRDIVHTSDQGVRHVSMARLVVTAVVGEGRSKSEGARDYGVSRRWVQILVQRFVADGEAGLEPRSRRPHRSPQWISEALEPGMNPQGVQLVSFKQPSSEELDHTLLWRISKALPERRRIGIFNRSHYEEVVALRVHPEWLDKQKRPLAIAVPNSGLAATTTSTPSSATSIGTARRSSSSISTSRRRSRSGASWPASTSPPSCGSSAPPTWPCGRTGTSTCGPTTMRSPPPPPTGPPWYILPADHKHVMEAMAPAIVVDTIGSLDLQWPTVSDEDRDANAQARLDLEAESE
jgi:hypothetical protein